MNPSTPDPELVAFVATLGQEFTTLSFKDKLKAKECFEKVKTQKQLTAGKFPITGIFFV
jgi:hypothetical protein